MDALLRDGLLPLSTSLSSSSSSSSLSSDNQVRGVLEASGFAWPVEVGGLLACCDLDVLDVDAGHPGEVSGGHSPRDVKTKTIYVSCVLSHQAVILYAGTKEATRLRHLLSPPPPELSSR